MRRLAQENEEGPKGMNRLAKRGKDFERCFHLTVSFHNRLYCVWCLCVQRDYFRSPTEGIDQAFLHL